MPRLAILLGLLIVGAVHAGEKQARAPHPIPARHWDAPFRPGATTLVGSYTGIIRRGENDFVAFNNTAAGDLAGGLVMWRGKDHLHFEKVGVVFTHEQITDVFGREEELFAERRLTRPFIDWHPAVGFVGVIHVCAGYPPVDARVYPALVKSPTGEAGSWTYRGKLAGEIRDAFGDGSGQPRWADGGGFFYRHDGSETVDRQKPLTNRYLFFSNQYAGDGSLTLLYSADGQTWYFHRRDGEIVNLIPMFAGRRMIFPHVVPMGEAGWTLFLSENWPPVAIYRLWSRDGLQWRLFDPEPAVRKPADLSIKNLNGWFDPRTQTLHGYLSVWTEQPGGGMNYDKFHSSTRLLTPP